MNKINSSSGLDHIHQINCDLQPRCRSNAWNLQPPEQSPLVSFLLDVPLPEQEPAIGPVLLQTLMREKGKNWELLIPGKEPTWLDSWRNWLSGALRVFPNQTGRCLQQNSHINACGEWLLPVQISSSWNSTLLDQIQSFSGCFPASRWLLGSGPAWLQSRQALWDTDTEPNTKLLADATIDNPGRWSINLPTANEPNSTKHFLENRSSMQVLPFHDGIEELDVELHAEVSNALHEKGWPLVVLADQCGQPCWLMIDQRWRRQLGGETITHPKQLLHRAEAIGMPPRLWCINIQGEIKPNSSGSDSFVVHERSRHGLLFHQRNGDTWTDAAEAWKRSGFRVIPCAACLEHEHKQTEWASKLRWITWLSSDSLISIHDLDQLREALSASESPAVMPNRLDRGTGLRLDNSSWDHDPTGVTWHATEPLPPKNTWQVVPQTWLAIDNEPNKPEKIGSRAPHLKQMLKRILHGRR